MSKLLKINVLCIVISMLINIFPDIVGAEDYLWENRNSSEMFNVDDYITSAEEIDNDNENDYVEPYKQFLIKYIDSNGEKLEIEKTYINSYFDMIQLSSEIDTEQYIKNLKENNENIAYIQQDYKLILSTSDTETETVPETNIEENNPFGLKTIYPKELFPTNQSQETNIVDSVIDTNNVIVAVIDSGIDIEHDALKDNIFVNSAEIENNSDSDNNGYIDDISGWDFVNNTSLSYEHNQIVEYSHGTHVAGIIAGNSDEIQGVHSKAQILPLKAFESGSGYTSDIIKSIDYAEKMGASIVNCSFSSDDKNRALQDVIAASHMLFVCAAGNSARDLDDYPVYPASYDLENVISVAAIDNGGSIAYFSNYGDAIDIAANGVSIKSSIPENEYGNSSGTSSAAAYITGIAADIISETDISSFNQIKEKLWNTANYADTLDNAKYNIKAINIASETCTLNEKSNDIGNSSIKSFDEQNDSSSTGLKVTQISAGGYHSAVMVDEDAYLFGNLGAIDGNYYWGEDDVSAPGYKMFGVSPPYGSSESFVVRKISTRGDHNLILLSDGTVRSIGKNNYGQLGVGYVDGYIGDGYESTWQVLGLTNIVDIAAGHQFSMALDSSGRVYAWGNNKDGQIGNGNSYPFFTTPQLVTDINNISSISAGHYHALAQKEDGTVYGWGRAINNALGNQKNEKCYSPVVLDITNVDKIVAGLDNSFFIKSDNTVYACGNNAYGQLGNGTLNSSPDIAQLSIDNVVDISSNLSTIFLKRDGTAYGCGSNAYGQLGIGSIATVVRNIVQIPGTYVAISTGGNHTLFLKSDGLYSAGRNQKKQCGFENITNNYLIPTLIPEFAQNQDSSDSNTELIEEKEINITTEEPYTIAISVTNIENIKNKIFVVDYDNSKLSLNDVCAQTWKKDLSTGTIADTDITLISASDSQIRFKVDKPQEFLSGTINLIKFDALSNCTTKIKVTALTQ